jgi:mRNA-degrading endonuclease RelE of RelBE toxin-antitoxin system
MPRLLISQDFLESYGKLPRNTQKKVRGFLEKFARTPELQGLNFEALRGTQDARVRSARIDRKYRVIMISPGDHPSFVLLWVDKHDEAIAWAMGRRFSIDPVAEVLRIVEAAHYPVLPVSGIMGFLAGWGIRMFSRNCWKGEELSCRPLHAIETVEEIGELLRSGVE